MSAKFPRGGGGGGSKPILSHPPMFSGSRKIPTLGSTVQWETRQASFPIGTVGPRVGIFLSPLNINDGFYLSIMDFVEAYSDFIVCTCMLLYRQFYWSLKD